MSRPRVRWDTDGREYTTMVLCEPVLNGTDAGFVAGNDEKISPIKVQSTLNEVFFGACDGVVGRGATPAQSSHPGRLCNPP